MAKKNKVKLQYPITVDDEVIEIITFSRIKVKHLDKIPDCIFRSEEEAKNVTMEELIPLMAALSDIPEHFDEVDMVDISNIADVVVSLVGEHQADGEK